MASLPSCNDCGLIRYDAVLRIVARGTGWKLVVPVVVRRIDVRWESPGYWSVGSYCGWVCLPYAHRATEVSRDPARKLCQEPAQNVRLNSAKGKNRARSTYSIRARGPVAPCAR